jgi:hypothetical protein
MIEKDDILNELVYKQLKSIPNKHKLQFSDIKRMCKYINNSIFDENECTLWNGYVTNNNNNTKGKYINFYFRKKKVALHRLLYNNYVQPLGDNEYLKFSCENKGKCCNIHHLNKFEYNKICKTKEVIAPSKNVTDLTCPSEIKIINGCSSIEDQKKYLYLEFD